MNPSESSAALHGKRSGLADKLKVALLAGNATGKIRDELAAVDLQIAQREHADAVAAEQAQAAIDQQIRIAAEATADAINTRIASVMADLAPPPTEITPMDDGAITAAAADLERANAELDQANSNLAAASEKAAALTNRKVALEDRRAAIVARRTGGDPHAADGAELALIQADLEGLRSLEPGIAAPVVDARAEVAAATASRARAAKALSDAEDRVLADALRERLAALSALMSDALARDDARLKRQRQVADWVVPADLLNRMQLRNASRPDLAKPTWRTAAIAVEA
jgi:chromosome segregation ATPase